MFTMSISHFLPPICRLQWDCQVSVSGEGTVEGGAPERLALSSHLVGWMVGPLQDDCMISKLLGLAPGKILAQIIGYNCYLHLFGKAKSSYG